MRGFNKEIQKSLSGSDAEFDRAGKKAGGRFSGAIGGALKGVGKAGLVGIAATAAAGVGMAFTKGLDRYMKIENAQQKLKALGNSAEDVQRIMEGANKAVKGTAFGMGDAADVAAAAVASGIKPGEQLDQVLRTIANSAAIAGTDMASMGAIFNKAAASGKVQGDILAQLGDRGVPAVQFLAKELGVTAEQVYELGSKGKISFEQFERAMRNGMDPNAAVMMGNTLKGTWENTQAALGRLGAEFMKVIGPGVKAALEGFIGLVDRLTGSVSGMLSGFAGTDGAVGAMGRIREALEPLRAAFQRVGDVVGPIIRDVGEGIRKFAEEHGPAFRRAWESIASGTGAQIESIATIIRSFADGLQWLWDQFGDDIMAGASRAFSGFVTAIEGTAKILEGVFKTLAAVLQGDWSAAWSGMETTAGGSMTVIRGLFDVWVAQLAPILEPVGTAWQGTWDRYLKPVWDNIKSHWDTVLKPTVEDIGARWKANWERDVKPSWDSFKTGWNDTLKSSWDQIKSHWDTTMGPTVDELGAEWKRTWEQGIKPAWDDLKRVWNDTLKPAWNDIKRSWDEQLKPAVDSLRETWNDLWYNNLKPVWDDFKRRWDDTLGPAMDDVEGTANEFSGNKGGSGSGPKLGTAWTVLSTALKLAASMIVTALTSVITIINAVVTALSWLLRQWNSTWNQMSSAVKVSVEFIVNTVYDAGLKPAFNSIASALGMSFRLPAARVSFSPPNTMFAGGGSAMMGQFYDGGWTGPGGKFQPKGLVHGDEHVWTKEESRRFPGGHAGLERLRAATLRGDLGGMLPGFFMGGQVPLPGATSIVRHSGYSWARWAGDLNAPNDRGKPIVAWRDGVVAINKSQAGSYGNQLWINHGPAGQSISAHMIARSPLAPGSQVRAGQTVGRVGNTGRSFGDHLHWELRGGNAPITAASAGGAADSFIDYVGQFRDSIAGTMGRLSELGASPWGQMMKQLPEKLVEGMLGKVKDAAASMFASDSVGFVPGGSGTVPGLAGVTANTYAKASNILAATRGAGHRVSSVGGYRGDGEHVTRRALDFMVGNKAAGDWISSYVLGNKGKFGLQHVIWWQRINSGDSRGWRPMANRGSFTQNHMDHPHVLFSSSDKGLLGGGFVTRSGRSWLSEDGRPELVVGPQVGDLRAGTRVLNADDTEKVMGEAGARVVVHQTINNPLAEPTSDSVMAASGMLAAQVLTA